MRSEALVGLAKRSLGVEAFVARRGDDVEQELAEEVLIVDVQREIQTWRLDLHARGSLEHALRGEERRKLARDASQERLRALALLVSLNLLPLREEIAADDLLALEHVRMAADELLVQAARDLVRVERSLLARELRVNRDLEEKVAKLVAKACGVARIKRGKRLVRLLEQVRPQRRVGLLAVPRAAVWRAESLGDAHHRVERCQIRERLERREDEEARAGGGAFRFDERGGAVGLEERDRVSGGVARTQDRPVDGTIQRDGDGAQRRERMPVEAARWDDIDSGGPALEDCGKRRRAIRTRGQE